MREKIEKIIREWGHRPVKASKLIMELIREENESNSNKEEK